MNHMIELILTIFGTVIASSGFWSFVQSRSDQNSGKNKLLLGLAHVQIVDAGMKYIERGWITREEFNSFIYYLYEPYEEMGGNGLAKSIADRVKDLPIRNDASFKETANVRSTDNDTYSGYPDSTGFTDDEFKRGAVPSKRPGH